MKNSAQLAVYEEGRIHCLFDKNEIQNFTPQMLSSTYWHNESAVTGSAEGRGTTWFVKYDNNQEQKHWVLRHYYRGGLIGKIINDSYFFSTQKNTRAAKEFALLAYMQTLALPAPKPIAYRIVRHGFLYRADLLSSRIENAQDLVAILTKKTMNDSLWFAIGKVIKEFHSQGIYHHDLNAHNILIDDDNKPWLIDFDQGEIKTVHKSWQQQNMNRLLRSFQKELNKLPVFNWQESNWQALLDGYHQ